MKEPLTARADLADAPKSALPLKAAVGANAAPGADVLTVKNSLRRLGFYTPPKFPDGVRRLNAFPDREMTDGLKAFQKRFGLKQDGIVQPGGPTERLLTAALGMGPKDAAEAAQRMLSNGRAGNGKEEDSATLEALIQALTVAGNAAPMSNGLPGRKTDAARFAVEDFQRDFQALLRRDGKAPVGGKTIKLIGRVLSLIQTGDKKSLAKGKEKAAAAGPFTETVIMPNGRLVEQDNSGTFTGTHSRNVRGADRVSRFDTTDQEFPNFEKEDFDPDGPGEIVHGLRNMLDLPTVNRLNSEAQEVAEKIYGEHTGTGEANAFLHGYFSYRLTQELGEKLAKSFTDAHEAKSLAVSFGSPDTDKRDKVIDLYNNRIGRELAVNTSKSKNPKNVILKAIRDGKFKNP